MRQPRRFDLLLGLYRLTGTGRQQGDECERHEGCEALAHGHDRVGDFKVPAIMPAIASMIKFNRMKCDVISATKRLRPFPAG